MKFSAPLLLAFLMTGCSVINLGINRPLFDPPGRPFEKCQSSPPAHEWESFDGTRLPYVMALPKESQKPRAVVILVPGWDGVTGDFRYLTDRLVKHGYAVYGSELRSQIYDPHLLRRGWAWDWHDWVRDLQCFTEQVRARHPGVPLYYHGHSMGCIIALQAVGDSPPAPVRGLILQSPAVALMPDHQSPQEKIIRFMLGWARPPQLLLMSLLRRELTGDASWDSAWDASPDRLRAGYTMRFINQASRMGHEALLTSRQMHPMPVLVLAGGQDAAATVLQPKDRLRHYIQDDLHASDPGSLVESQWHDEGHHLLTAGDVPRKKGGLVKEAATRDILEWLDRQSAGGARR